MENNNNSNNKINKENLKEEFNNNINKDKNNNDSNNNSSSNESLKSKVKEAVNKIKEKSSPNNKNSNQKKNKCEDELEKLKKLVIELRNDKLRTLADFENFRRRKEEEMAHARERAIIDFVMDLLPAIDNFEMSLKMTDNTEMFIKGVEMIHKNLIDTLKEHKIEAFEPSKGEEFDPHKHDPVLIDEEGVEKNQVINVIKKGFKKGDKIIRPARVQVKN